MHWRLRRLAETARQVAWQSFSRRVLPVRIDGGIVSFTFDDVPESAISAGSKVLEKHGASGTFYLAGGLADTNGETEPFFHAESVAELIARGHEVGCHTFSHRRVSDIPGAAAVEECERNRQWMAAIAPDYSLCSFAYPEGAVSVAAKRALGDRFVTCRWNQDGINVGNVDMTLLRANKIYSRLDNMAALKALIDENAARGGWLVFYTHDVADAPSRYGCTAADLEAIVVHAAESRSKVLSMRNAVGALAFTF